MPGSSPLQLYSYPTTGDQASPAGIQTLAQAVEKQVVAVFADTTTRDSRWTSATGLANGAMCFITATGELQLRSGGAWVVIGGRAAPFAVATGTASFAFSANDHMSGAISFPAGRFSQIPVVFALGPWNSGSYLNELVFTTTVMSTTSFTLHANARNGTAITATYTVAWMAVQMTSTSATG